jgi:cation transport regulator ChaB
MEEGIEERLSAGREARQEERGVSQEVNRLQRQVDALYAERRHFAGRVEQLSAAEDHLQARCRSWIRSLFSRDLTEQFEAAREETFDAEDRLDEADREFEAARVALAAARGQQEAIAGVTSDYEAALDLKERNLIDAGDPRAERLREITAGLEREAAVLRDTDDLLTSVGWSDRALDTLEHLVGRARRSALTDLADGSFMSGKAKYDELGAVGTAAAYAERCLAKLKDELRLYGERQHLTDGLQVDARARFLDIWIDSPYRDLRSFLEIVKTQNRIPRTRSLLQQIGDDLRLRRAETLTTTDTLTTERTTLLTH